MEDSSKRFLDLSRFWVQRVLVPIVVVVGVAGNLITVIILTRKRMKCSTNVYLTALAIADLVYLLFVFILSFEHYPGIHNVKYALYWRFYGINHWLVDAASYISIWLTVSFTVERYIAVCHPIRGKVLCTENRAKRVIAAVCVLCLISTASTSFEYQMEYKTDDINGTKSNGTDCSLATNYHQSIEENTFNSSLSENGLPTDATTISSSNRSIPFAPSAEVHNCSIEEETYSRIEICPTSLGTNGVYQNVFYWFTCIGFIFVPLLLLAMFNCFLISAVHRSQKQRHKMTNSQERSSATQENRITVTLIAVVILFLVCQSPPAGMLIYTTIHHPADDTTESNIIRGLGNYFNFLVNLNAACNFLLYCALSDKYRRTFRAVFMGGRWGTSSRHDTLYTSSMSMSRRYHPGGTTVHSSGTHYHLANGAAPLKRNISAYTQRALEADRLKRIARAKSMITRPVTTSTDVTYY